ncbi:MAG: discoidin domain-containing protein [Planctomycetaceae bacterium]|nr:discoidin domain-containing protein [Planctomycetaceae bacterium]
MLPVLFAATWTNAADQPKKTVEVILQADSEDEGYEAFRAMDGDKKTLWHSHWRGTVAPQPHTLTIDMTAQYEIKGLEITPRSDNLNGIINSAEVFVSDNPKQLGEPVFRGNLPNDRKPQRVKFEKNVKGRYVVLKTLSEHGSGPYTSIAELEILCDAAAFKAKKVTTLSMKMDAVKEAIGSGTDEEHLSEFLLLTRDIMQKARFDKIAAETYDKQSLILDSDCDPADIVLRRTTALLADVQTLPACPDLSVQKTALDELKKEVETVPVEQTKQRFEVFAKISKVRREIAFANPLLSFKELLFIKKHRAAYNHMCDQYYGINLPSGGGIFVMPFDIASLAKGDLPPVRNIIESAVVESGRLKGKTLSTGSFLSPDISYDAGKLTFAYVECEGDTDQRFHTDPAQGHWNQGRCFHIFTADLGTNFAVNNLRQITDGTWNDFDPCFLPNGRIAFITERRGGYLRCGRACPTYTLFDMNPDGSAIRCLSYHETNEWHPSVTNDGRLLYTRWDYPDRHGCVAHQPWVSTLDGRDTRQVHGNFTPRELRPDMELDCRSIPDSAKFVATAAPHHGQSYGSLVLVDPRIPDDDAMAPVKRLTPDVDFPETQGGAQVYGAPYPLSEKYYLCVADFSMNVDKGAEWHNRNYTSGSYGIYLADVFGNKELIYRDPKIGCNSPMPLVPRPSPAVAPQMISENIENQPYILPEREKLAQREQGTVAITNVYETLRPYPAGTKIKELRVIQLIPMSVPSGGKGYHQPFETAHREPTSGDSVVLCRNVWGTVPVEEDGSVHFKVPPRREFQLQVVDEEGLAVQSMRSSIYLHDGETLSCTGCHEQQANAVKPVSGSQPKAFTKPAAAIKPSFADAVNFSYPRLIQPIWDAHCVECHQGERAKGTKNVPDMSRTLVPDGGNNGQWYASYKELKPYLFYSYGERHRTAPGKFGARASKLYPLLFSPNPSGTDNHYGVKLSEEERQKIALWLDCVSPFYGVYEKEGGETQLQGKIAYPTLE